MALRAEARRAAAPDDARALLALGSSPESTAMSKDLRKRGWTFVGPTTVYAFMQAMGLVNDHIESCHVARRRSCKRRARPDAADLCQTEPAILPNETAAPAGSGRRPAR
jgi:hypothetical protein